MKKYSFILGSQSPRRKELISWLKINYEILVPDVDETSSYQAPRDIVESIALKKAYAIKEGTTKRPQFGNDFFPFIVTADTIVTLGNKIFGKPSNQDDARKMLLELSGREHVVYTSVAMTAYDRLHFKWKESVFSCSSSVRFEDLSEDILSPYLVSGESLDKAGAYGIQGMGLTFISHLEGSYSNVVGFPLSHFLQKMKEFLSPELADNSEKWRELFV